MRRYINQIDEDLIKAKFTQEELNTYKQLTKELDDLQKVINSFEKDAKNRLEACVIGKLEKLNFNYLAIENTFYMSYSNNKPHKKWYEFWK